MIGGPDGILSSMSLTHCCGIKLNRTGSAGNLNVCSCDDAERCFSYIGD